MLEKFYESIGGSFRDVMTRIPSEDIIKRFILKFENDESYKNAAAAFTQGDIKEAFLAAHTLKGVAKNLGFDRLGDAASNLTEALRNAQVLPPDELLTKVTEEYNAVIDAIKLLK